MSVTERAAHALQADLLRHSGGAGTNLRPVAHREVRTTDGAHAPDFTILRLYLSARALAPR